MKRKRAPMRGAAKRGAPRPGAAAPRARMRRARLRRARVRSARRPVARRSWARWWRRGVLAAALLAVAFIPGLGPASGQQAAACHGCRAQTASAQRWTARLSGSWAVDAGTAGTVPASGQAYVAAGGGVVAVGDGLTVTGYRLHDGHLLWQLALSMPVGSTIISVRAWPGVVTVGVVAPGGRSRTEVVIDTATGVELARYPAAVFGGAVSASKATTVIVGPTAVTSYDNAAGGRVRWQRQTGQGQSWRTDGGTLYVAESAAGYLGSAPVTGLRVINLGTGAMRVLQPPPGRSFGGTMTLAADGVVLLSSASGVTAYSGSTGGTLWSKTAVVPEGADPVARLIYLTSSGGALVGVNPLTGKVRTVVSGATAGGSAGIYVVRGGVALGLDEGQGGEAWGYNTTAGRVTWTAAGLPWPHYFADLSGLGGSADESGSTVVVAVCTRVAKPSAAATTPAATGTPLPTAGSPAAPDLSGSAGATASSSASAQGSPSAAPVRLCAAPELVALSV